MSDKRFFAVDLGASGGKCFAGIFGNDGFTMREVHRFAHEGTSFFVPDRKGKMHERTYWDDVLLYGNILHGLQAYSRDVAKELDSIGIDAWGADGCFLTADGDMLGNIYCYRDHRLDNMIKKVQKRMDPTRIYSITGIHFQPFNVSNQLLWFATQRKKLMRQADCFLPVPALFYYYLGGIKKIDSAWASVTQVMDARERRWSRELLEALDIPEHIMPEIVAPGTVIGELHAEVASQVGLNRAKLTAVGSHDTACAFASAPVNNPDEALIISSGTWSLLGKLIPEPITNEAAMAANISNEGGIGNVRFLKNCMGSWLVQELRRVWRKTDGQETPWKELDRITEAAKPFTAFVDPDNPMFYNPSNMEEAIVKFCRNTGQPVPADRGTYLRVVYESLALKYRQVNDQICRVCGKTTTAINVVGGGSKNILLNQCTADATGLPVLAGPDEATAVGNIMVQAMGLGVIKSLQDAQPIIRNAFPIREYKPGPRGAWDEAYARFLKIATK